MATYSDPYTFVTNSTASNTTSGSGWLVTPNNPASTVTQPMTGTGFHPQCVYNGCEASDEVIDYLDGVVIAYCIHCGARLKLPRIAGALNYQAVKDFFAVLVAEEGDTSEALGRLAELRIDLGIELDALNEAAELLRLAEEMLRQRGSLDG